MYTHIKQHKFGFFNKSVSWDSTSIMKRDPISLNYSPEYLKSFSATISISNSSGTESGEIEIYTALSDDSISNIISTTSPLFVFTIQNGVFVDSPSPSTIIIPNTIVNYDSDKKIIIRNNVSNTADTTLYTGSCSVTVLFNYVYDFVASLPVDGYVQKEVDSISGIELPLIKFYPE